MFRTALELPVHHRGRANRAPDPATMHSDHNNYFHDEQIGMGASHTSLSRLPHQVTLELLLLA